MSATANAYILRAVSEPLTMTVKTGLDVDLDDLGAITWRDVIATVTLSEGCKSIHLDFGSLHTDMDEHAEEIRESIQALDEFVSALQDVQAHLVDQLHRLRSEGLV